MRIMKVLIERQTRIFDDFFKIEEALLQYEKFDGKMTPTLRRLKVERKDSVAAHADEQTANGLCSSRPNRTEVNRYPKHSRSAASTATRPRSG